MAKRSFEVNSNKSRIYKLLVTTENHQILHLTFIVNKGNFAAGRGARAVKDDILNSSRENALGPREYNIDRSKVEKLSRSSIAGRQVTCVAYDIPSQSTWEEEPNWKSPKTNLDKCPESDPTLELYNRAAPSVEAHHRSVGPDVGRNSGGRQIKKYAFPCLWCQRICGSVCLHGCLSIRW